MSHRTVLLGLASCAAFAAGWASRGGERAPGADRHPETVEVFRPPASDRPAVAETLRILTATDDGAAERLAGSRGPGRAVWTVRVNRNGRVATYTAESVVRD